MDDCQDVTPATKFFNVRTFENFLAFLSRGCSRFPSLEQMIDFVVVALCRSNYFFRNAFDFFDYFNSRCIGHTWAVWMGTEKHRSKTFGIHNTYFYL